MKIIQNSIKPDYIKKLKEKYANDKRRPGNPVQGCSPAGQSK